jgi:hypothetical protein
MYERYDMQDVTPVDFLQSVRAGIDPHAALIAWGRLRTGSLEDRIEDLPTLYDIPTPVSPRDYTTEEMVARILLPEGEMYIERESSSMHTIDLVQDAVRELLERGHTPRMIMLSRLRYMALGDLTFQLKYYYRGVHVPFVPTCGGAGKFEVRVYGSKE